MLWTKLTTCLLHIICNIYRLQLTYVCVYCFLCEIYHISTSWICSLLDRKLLSVWPQSSVLAVVTADSRMISDRTSSSSSSTVSAALLLTQDCVSIIDTDVDMLLQSFAIADVDCQLTRCSDTAVCLLFSHHVAAKLTVSFNFNPLTPTVAILIQIIFNIWALWRSIVSVRVPRCQKFQMTA